MRKLAAYFQWQEDLDKLDNSELAGVCSKSVQKLGTIESSIVAELEHAAFIYMKRVLGSCTRKEAEGFAPHLRKLHQLMSNTFHKVVDGTVPHQSRTVNWLSADAAFENDLLDRAARTSTDGSILCRHGDKLVSILRGEVTAIEVLMEDDPLNNWYQFGIGFPQIYDQLSRYIDLLAHKKPDMKILEIGAGTGGQP